MSKIDLHVHTTASDGKFTPFEIVQKAQLAGLTHLAITDHDTVEGVSPALQAAEAYPWLTIIPGVEINTDVPGGELHVLGYFIEYSNSELTNRLKRLCDSRLERARKMVEKLCKLGVNISMERVLEIAGGAAIGRPHLAQAMLEKGYISTFREAFNRYIGHDCPAYVEREKIEPSEAVQLVHRAGGLPVMAHPFTVENPEAIMVELKTAGLVGIEVYYGSYTPDQIKSLLAVAQKHGLLATGGSDYHGNDPVNESMLGAPDVPLECVENLIALARR